jgi:hypothetical protein
MSPQHAPVQKAKIGMENSPSHERPEYTPRDLLIAVLNKVPPSIARKLLQKGLSDQQLVRFMTGMVSEQNLRLGLTEWSERHLRSFKDHYIESDIERLVGLGIRRETIAVGMMTICFSTQIDAAFAELGSRRSRHRRAKTLLKAVPVLQDLVPMFGTLPDEVPAANVPNPAKIIRDLKFLSSVLSWGEWLSGFLGGNSFLEVSRFAFANFVYEATGHFLDREVSRLTGTALSDEGYDETRHRVWRINNRERLREDTQIATRLLVALNDSLSQPPT